MADLTRSEAWELLTKYNKEPFHLRHALTVEGIMKYFAKELGYADEADFWAQVGLLHDLDFEVYPAEHCLKSQEIMREHGLDERLIRATASHDYGLATYDRDTTFDEKASAGFIEIDTLSLKTWAKVQGPSSAAAQA